MPRSTFGYSPYAGCCGIRSAVVAKMPPTLAIASSVDGVIPFAESEAMVQAMRAVEDGPPVEFRTVDVPHGAFPYAPDFWQAVDDYLAGVTQA